MIQAYWNLIPWPLAAHAQQHERPRIGVLMTLTADDREGRRASPRSCKLQEANWAAMCSSTFAGDRANAQQATEMVALATDVILASSPLAVSPLRDATRTTPIVFTAVFDFVAFGFVENLARPGDNHRLPFGRLQMTDMGIHAALPAGGHSDRQFLLGV